MGYLDYLINRIFQGVNSLFLFYHLKMIHTEKPHTVEIKDYNLLMDEKTVLIRQ